MRQLCGRAFSEGSRSGCGDFSHHFIGFVSGEFYAIVLIPVHNSLFFRLWTRYQHQSVTFSTHASNGAIKGIDKAITVNTEWVCGGSQQGSYSLYRFNQSEIIRSLCIFLICCLVCKITKVLHTKTRK